MNLQIFICFHQKIFHEIYEINDIEKKKYLTFYGVKNKDIIIDEKIIYEYELNIFNSNLQKNKYNEASSIYHVYINNLYDKYDYIGFCQYDMIFKNLFFKNISNIILTNSNTIFYLEFFEWAFYGGQTTIIKDYKNIPAGLKNYNNFFNTNFTIENIIKNKMIICNTFIIPKKMYVKMMSWLIQYFNNDINKLIICDDGYNFNPGHMIEALVSMFLSLEINNGAKYFQIDLMHDHKYKIIS